MDYCNEEGHKEESQYYCISDGIQGCNKCMEQSHSGHLYFLVSDLITNAIQGKQPIEAKSTILSNYERLVSSLSTRVEYKKKALSIICEVFRNSIVKHLAGSIKGDIAFCSKIKAHRDKAEASVNTSPILQPEKKTALDELMKNRKWNGAISELNEYLKYLEMQEHINIFAAEYAKSEISLDFLHDFVQYMSAIEQEIYANIERKDVEYEKLIKSISESKVEVTLDYLY
jgi:hypothetical protein